MGIRHFSDRFYCLEQICSGRITFKFTEVAFFSLEFFP